MESVAQIFVNSIGMSITYLLVALGLTLAFGIMKVLNFAHGSIYMVAAYVLYVFCSVLGLNYFLAAFISILLTSVLGLIIERVAIRPVRTEALAPFLTTMGIAMLLEHGALLTFGIHEKGISSVFTGILNFFGVTISLERLVVILIGGFTAVIFYLLVSRTKQGRAMRAVGQNADAAALLGINPTKMFAYSMFLGSALAAVAAVLMAPIYSISSNMGFIPMFKGFIIIILGGVGSIPGCFLAAFILGFLDSIGATLLGWEISSIVGFVLLMLILIIRPSGLVPRG